MKLMLLDGNSIINRAFYGIRMLTTSGGLCTNGVYGFLNIYKKLLDEETPDAVCAAFDLAAPTFRHLQFEGYKATRKGMPEELAMQMPLLKEALDAMGVRRAELAGYEADDIIGTLSARAEAMGWESVIVTGDKDSFQLIGPLTRVKHVKSRMGQTETTDYDVARFVEEYGFEPGRIIDLKALMGDASDNIPGVRGVGEKTAVELIRANGSLENVYAHLDALKPAVSAKLEAGRESALMSFRLATIDRSIPLELEPAACTLAPADNAAVLEIFRRLEFFKLIDKWGLRDVAPANTSAAEATAAVPAAPGELDEALAAIRSGQPVTVLALPGLSGAAVRFGGKTMLLSRDVLGSGFDAAMAALFSPDVKKIVHDLKSLSSLLTDEKLPLGGIEFDTMLAAYLLSPTDSVYTIQKLAQTRLGLELPPESVWAAPDAFAPLADHSQALSALGSYAAAVDALHGLFSQKLAEQGMDKLLRNIEMPLAPVLTQMEKAGFLIDKKALTAFGELLSTRIAELESMIYAQSGGPFNINSTKQLGEVLFERLMLPYGKRTKTGWSTNVDVLEKLMGKHPVVEMVMEYRKLTKLKSTYCDGLLKVISPDGRIHTSFTMTVTATGRLSSTEPNLQNIPVRTELGRELRRMFAAPPGMLLVDADYSQIELRLLAHISGDQRMREAFLAGEDIHARTAAQVFGVEPAQVTPLMRSRAKAVNFGIVYGISAFSLAGDIGVSVAEAKAYIDAYLENFSGVRDYMKRIVEQAKADGWVSTIMGRRRDIPELSSANRNLRSFGERVALNTPIQGSAADIIKLAMINVARRLADELPECRLIMQVHDELIVEAPQALAPRAAELLTFEMQNAVSLSVPLTADAKWGVTWYDAK